MEVYYRDRAFIFEPSAEFPWKGCLRLDERSRGLLAHLIESEDDDWYLDGDGERLLPEELFLRTPWSFIGPHGKVGLLCRLIDHRDDSILFDTSDTYLGEMHAWIRGRVGD